MRYRFIQKHTSQVPVSVLCRALKVSKSGYYDFKKLRLSKRAQEREQLLIHIRQFFEKSDRSYGSIRIWEDLKECDKLKAAGIRAGRHRVARLMRQAGLKARVAPKFVVTTDSKHGFPIAENLLNREFGATEANTKWASGYPCCTGDHLHLDTGRLALSGGCLGSVLSSNRGLVYAAEYGSLARFKGSGNGAWPTPSGWGAATSQRPWQSGTHPKGRVMQAATSRIVWNLLASRAV